MVICVDNLSAVNTLIEMKGKLNDTQILSEKLEFFKMKRGAVFEILADLGEILKTIETLRELNDDNAHFEMAVFLLGMKYQKERQIEGIE